MGKTVFFAWLLAAGCGGSSSSNGSSGTGAGTGPAAMYAGVYNARYAGTYVVTSPAGLPGGSNTDTGTVTITALSADAVHAVWQIPPNPPSGAADFTLNGAQGTAEASGGMCFNGKLTNGDTQTNCCTACSISFSGNTFVQPNAGTFTGTTALGVAYAGTYSGQWTGTKQ
jgi:hypothetical protein